MKNLEIKAKVNNLEKIESLFKQLGAKKIETMRQIDTYFQVKKGRLKLRKFSPTASKLIYYERVENSQQRWSNYYTFPVAEPDNFVDFLKNALPIKIIVDKKRTIYEYENAKIHLDEVAKLGKFIEIEVEVKKGEEQAKKLMNELLDKLKIPPKNFIKKSYSDLLLKKQKLH
jgi:adenylate cyclase, class 2